MSSIQVDKLVQGNLVSHSHPDSDVSSTSTLDALYVNVSGDTMTGNLTFNKTTPAIKTTSNQSLSLMPNGIGNVGLNTTSPDEKFTVVGNFSVKDADTPLKGYRFRTSGSDLDFDASGQKMWFSVYSGAGFTGTQRFYMALNQTSTDADVFGNWRFQTAPFGTNKVIILPNDTTPLEVVGTMRADGLRLDLTPTAETITPTHTIIISVNGTNYKIPLVAE